MRLTTYNERLEFREYESGIRVLLPSDLDLALLRMMVAQQDEQLVELEDEDPPGEVCQAKVALGPAEGEEKERLQQVVYGYEDRKQLLIEAWTRSLRATVKQLAKAERQVEGKAALGGQEVFRVFSMREFSKRERMEAEEEHSTLVEDADGTQRRELDIPARNLKLLSGCVLGEWVPIAEVAGQGLPTQKFGKEARALQPIAPEEVADLQDKVAQTLIERSWARNTMSAELAGFFDKQPPLLRWKES